jgi:hypothetical protein
MHGCHRPYHPVVSPSTIPGQLLRIRLRQLGLPVRKLTRTERARMVPREVRRGC